MRRSEAADDEAPALARVTIDGAVQDTGYVLLIDDHQPHAVEVLVNASALTDAALVAG